MQYKTTVPGLARGYISHVPFVQPPQRTKLLINRYKLTMTAEPQTLSLGPGATDLGRRILEHQAPQYTFSFTPFLLKNYRHGISPDRPTCKAYLQGHCPLGNSCPDKHITPNNNPNFNNLVCKHWLRGLCKKGDSCEFLHEFNLRKMPECSQFVRNGYCSNGGVYSPYCKYPTPSSSDKGLIAF